MKQTLSVEQSAELIKRGVSADKASMVCMNFNGTYAYVCGDEAQTLRDCVNSKFYVEESRVFTLTDLLSLLPKEIEKIYSIEICADNVGWDIVYGTYHEGYEPKHIAADKELVNALYTALLWAIDHNHVKLD